MTPERATALRELVTLCSQLDKLRGWELEARAMGAALLALEIGKERALRETMARTRADALGIPTTPTSFRGDELRARTRELRSIVQ